MTDRMVQSEMNSGNSELNRHNSRESVENQEISSSGFRATESLSTEWTDEKHSSFLNFMEASFVKQLYNDEYNSMDLLGWRSRRKNVQDPSACRHLSTKARTSSGQFKVLQSGLWKTIDFERAPHQLDCVDSSHVILENPWIQHFKSVEKQQEVTPPGQRENGAQHSGAIPLGKQRTNSSEVSFPSGACQDSVFSFAEVSDQNFVDEEKKPEHQSSLHRTKRTKTAAANLSMRDQVVPNGKSPIIPGRNKNYASLRKDTGDFGYLEAGSPYYTDLEPKGETSS